MGKGAHKRHHFPLPHAVLGRICVVLVGLDRPQKSGIGRDEDREDGRSPTFPIFLEVESEAAGMLTRRI